MSIDSKSPKGKAGNWFAISNALLDSYGTRLGPYGLAVYFALARRAGKKRTCYPSREDIAAMTGMSVASVKRALRHLIAIKLVALQRASRGRTSHVYRLLQPGPTDPVGGAQPGPTDPQPGPTDPDNRVPQTRKEDTGKKTKEEARAQGSERSQTESTGFARFWAAYPKQTDRDDAAEAWAEVGAEAEVEAVLAGVRWWSASDRWAEQGGRFVEKPAKFLRQRQWRLRHGQQQRTRTNSKQFRPEMADRYRR